MPRTRFISFYRNVQDNLENRGHGVEDAHGDLARIGGPEQIIFFCNGRESEIVRRSIIDAIQFKIQSVICSSSSMPLLSSSL